MNTYLPEGSLISTAKNHEYISTMAGLERALERQIILEAPAILCDRDYRLHVSLGAHAKGIIPREESLAVCAGESIKDIAVLTRVGKPVCFTVTGFGYGEEGERIAYLSRRRAQEECRTYYVSTLLPGDIVEARVTHLEAFGAFMDIGCGTAALLPIDSISVSRISHPRDRLSVGDRLCAVIRSIDERGRIYLSTKELLGTWEENAAQFSQGQTVKGIVRSVESYGIFIELTPNLAGLAEPKEGVRAGESAAVYIKSILPDRMKIKLILIDTAAEREPAAPMRTFIDTERIRHIDRFVYSPPESRRLIETVFSQ